MPSFVFLITLLTLFILGIGIIINAIKRKPNGFKFKLAGAILVVYAITWCVFDVLSKDVSTSLGTDICFDDWCATITQVELGTTTQKKFEVLHADSTWIVLTVKMSNHAAGIAQKPSEPRVHIVDMAG